jgi:hypothetical protein
MKDAGFTLGALFVGVLAVLCCAAPAIIAGVTMLAAWLSYSGYVLIAAALIAAAVGGVLLFRHHGIDAQACCEPEKKASNHE